MKSMSLYNLTICDIKNLYRFKSLSKFHYLFLFNVNFYPNITSLHTFCNISTFSVNDIDLYNKHLQMLVQFQVMMHVLFSIHVGKYRKSLYNYLTEKIHAQGLKP